MAILAGTALVSAGMGAYKAYQGYKQQKEGEKALAGLTRPEYQIPEELKKNLKESELRALEGLPTAQKSEFVKNIQRSQEAAMNQSASRKGGLMGINAAAQQSIDAFTNLTSMDAQARVENEQRLQANRSVMAAEKEKQYLEKKGYYMDDVASAQGMIGAGMQNKMSGIDQIASSAIQAGSAMYGANQMSESGATTQEVGGN